MASDNQLPDGDHVSRYCKPTQLEDELPMVAAFTRRQREDYLSVNWLEHFGERDPLATVQRVREAFRDKPYRVAKNARFALLNVAAAKTAVNARLNISLRVEHIPWDNDPSHSGILGYAVADDFAVAAQLRALVGRQDMHPAVK